MIENILKTIPKKTPHKKYSTKCYIFTTIRLLLFLIFKKKDALTQLLKYLFYIQDTIYSTPSYFL